MRKPELVQVFDIEVIQPSPENDQVYNPSDVQSLADDIKKRGLIDPLFVTKDLCIISGHRRYAACKLAGLKTVKCRVSDIYYGDPGFLQLLTACNKQRVKSVDEILREEIIDQNPDDAYAELIDYRKNQLNIIDDDDCMELDGFKPRCTLGRLKKPLLNAIQDIVYNRRDYWPLSVRQIHYPLLPLNVLRYAGKKPLYYTNNLKSYSACSDVCARARLEGLIPWEAIDDETRPTVVSWGDQNSQDFIKRHVNKFLKGYYRNLVQSQPAYIVIIGEKNTIHTAVRNVASEHTIPYIIGRGYCDLSTRYKLAKRFRASKKRLLVLIFVGDFDPDGEVICESFARSMRDDFGIDNIRAIKAALTYEQTLEEELPTPLDPKDKSANIKKFRAKYGADQKAHELEALHPGRLEELLTNAIDKVLDIDLYNTEISREREESPNLKAIRDKTFEFLAPILNGQNNQEDES